MIDLNVNTQLFGVNAVNGFVRENLVQFLKNSQKADDQDEQWQELATKPSVTDHSTEKAMPKEELDDTIRDLNDSLQNVQRNLEFAIDKEAGRIVINVKDIETDEVLRQIPSEEVLELARNLRNVNIQLNQEISERKESYSSQSTAGGVFLKTIV
ncbi:MAG: flagellar protein FlaG [Gammaproteobacteria bacterium]|nr:flagellar protein FlaG [Gammaproteobacteria bacterium]